ncbi:Mu transposase C-terminal domain-containing protein, partial [Klebsiella pneumoniae]|uniref:Mu transposase C-terminal domain-containing protein n=1 Tax=Klebsiella pneumoniae TaxID=573 RepID=UPI0027300C3B
NLGVSPAQAFEHGLASFGDREHTRIAYTDNFIFMTLPAPPSGKARVQSSAYVKINSIPYSADALRAPGLVGTDVPVRYDPFNMGV